MKKKKLQNYLINMNDVLGKGSFGQVCKGVDEKTGQAVAVKILRKKDIDRDEYIKNAVFLQIKITRKFSSENIVKIYDVLQTDHNYYIVQELCECDLRTWMRRDGKYSQQVATALIQQICIGFHELICNGVIHRDIKPQNILIRNKILKLADFGFAKNVSADYMNQSLVGTPLYMAPQILRRERYTSKCDIWSVGLIYFELMYGRLPWHGKSEMELLSNISHAQIPFHLEQSVTEQAKDFIKGCLQVDEKKRISWEDVYVHPLFSKRLEGMALQKSPNADYAITDLRRKVHSQNIDLEKLFKNRNLKQNIKFDQFSEVISTISHEIESKDVKSLFQRIDTDHNGSINLSSIKQVLTAGGISMNCKENMPKDINKSVPGVLVSQQIDDEDTKTWQRITEVIQKLQKRLSAKNYNLSDVHKKYDFNKDDVLDIHEFSKLMNKIDSELTEQEMRLCFRRFDLNNDCKITFEEFYRTLCKINGDPVAPFK